MVFLFYLLLHLCAAQNVTEYLKHYEYLNVDTSAINESADVAEALSLFQEFYKLPGDGTSNAETMEFMRRPRCGVPDNTASDFKLHRDKWTKKHLRWNFRTPNIQMKTTANKAFAVWQNVCGLSFEQNFENPDIVISMGKSYGGSKYHKGYTKCHNDTCLWPFDGKGWVLAHAYFPLNNTCIEIHLDPSENWYFESDIAPAGSASLYEVLIHEIGHTLGLHHSDDSTSVMYAYYGNNKLVQDDITAIRHLYGPPQMTTTTTTTALPMKPQPMKPTLDLCDKDVKELKFVIMHKNLYVFYKTWLWIMELETHKFKTRSLNIRNFLPVSIPGNFDTITAIYQRPNGELVLFINDQIYIIEYPSFQVRLHVAMSSLLLPTYMTQVIGAVNTYKGRTFLFFLNNYYVELDEPTLRHKKIGYISRDFPGIPSEISGVFRYTNGLLYFFQNGRYFAYDEFTESLQASDKIHLGLFGIDCPNLSLYEQLKILLKKILALNASD